MNDTTAAPSTEATATTEAKESKKANIVRGTIPHALVYMIRFHEEGNKEADVAKKYGTTSGKVADIVKNRNFAYIDADFKPTQEQKDAAIKWLKQVPDYDTVGTDAAVTAVDNLPLAGEADVAALATKRAAVREANKAAAGEAKPEGEAAPKAEKATKPKGAKAKAEAAAPNAAAVDALLS